MDRKVGSRNEGTTFVAYNPVQQSVSVTMPIKIRGHKKIKSSQPR